MNHNKIVKMAAGFAMLLLMAACGPAGGSEPTANTKTLFVGAAQVDCEGVAPQKCLLVKENADDEYTFFYDQIEGFEWEPGFEYELLVNVTNVENPPADGSSLQYELVEVVSKTAVADNSPISFLNGDWVLTELTVDGQTITLPTGAEVTLTIDGDQVSGSAGCNTFTGTATLADGAASFGPLATTRKACPEEVMAVETAVLQLFANATTYSDGRVNLILSSQDGSSTATFDHASETTAVSPELPSFLNGKWAFGQLIADGNTVRLPYSNFAYLTIDGQNVSGSAGCNDFSGTATFNEGSVNLSPLAVTRKMCADESVMAYENALLSILDNATSYEATGNAMTISNDDGSMSANLTPVRQQTLFVGPEQADCVGVGPQKCLLVKENADDDYTFFYDQIIGFEWEEGYDYELLVAVSDIANPPADASALRYELVEVVSQTAVSADE